MSIENLFIKFACCIFSVFCCHRSKNSIRRSFHMIFFKITLKECDFSIEQCSCKYVATKCCIQWWYIRSMKTWKIYVDTWKIWRTNIWRTNMISSEFESKQHGTNYLVHFNCCFWCESISSTTHDLRERANIFWTRDKICYTVVIDANFCFFHHCLYLCTCITLLHTKIDGLTFERLSSLIG